MQKLMRRHGSGAAREAVSPSPLPLDRRGCGQWTPAVDIQDDADEYLISIEVPGLERDDLRVEVFGGTLSVEGERRQTRDRPFLRQELRRGAFRRAFSLPYDAESDGITATYRNGILRLTVPRSESARPRGVPIAVL